MAKKKKKTGFTLRYSRIKPSNNQSLESKAEELQRKKEIDKIYLAKEKSRTRLEEKKQILLIKVKAIKIQELRSLALKERELKWLAYKLIKDQESQFDKAFFLMKKGNLLTNEAHLYEFLLCILIKKNFKLFWLIMKKTKPRAKLSDGSLMKLYLNTDDNKIKNYLNRLLNLEHISNSEILQQSDKIYSKAKNLRNLEDATFMHLLKMLYEIDKENYPMSLYSSYNYQPK